MKIKIFNREICVCALLDTNSLCAKSSAEMGLKMDQNLNLYHIFYEVSLCRNFSAAAKRLYITQPAVSRAIARLEEGLHTVLFRRSSRGVTLTEEGEVLFRHVESALLSLRTGEELLLSAEKEPVSLLSIGVSTTLCKYVLLPGLKEFVDRNPHIKLTILCQSTFETLAQLKSGALSIGLVGIPKDRTVRSISGHTEAAGDSACDKAALRQSGRSDGRSGGCPVLCEPLMSIEDIFVASDTYLAPFRHRDKAKGTERDRFFEEATFIMLDRENISRKHTDAFLAAHGLTLHHIIEVNNMDLSIEFARAGLGVACVIRDFVREDIRNGTLRELKFTHKVPKRSIGFAWPARLPVSQAMDTLIEYYRSLCEAANTGQSSNKGVEK